jgi:putative transposase
MVRRLRVAAGGVVYHVLNRAVGRDCMFRKEADYKAFEKVLLQAHERTGTGLLAYCLMPDHWHLVLWPREGGELSQYVRWLSVRPE